MSLGHCPGNQLVDMPSYQLIRTFTITTEHDTLRAFVYQWMQRFEIPGSRPLTNQNFHPRRYIVSRLGRGTALVVGGNSRADDSRLQDVFKYPLEAV